MPTPEVVGCQLSEVPGNPLEEEEEEEEAGLIVGKPVKPPAEASSLHLGNAWRGSAIACLCGALLLAGFLAGNAAHGLATRGARAQAAAAAPAPSPVASEPRPGAARALPLPQEAPWPLPAAPLPRPESSGEPPSASPAGSKQSLDPGRGLDLRQLEAPVSRSLLALGVPGVIPGLRRPRHEVFYMEMRGESVLEAAWKAGWPGIAWQGPRGLPFSNFAFDVIVVGSAWCVDECTERVVDEWLRVLRPGGKLLVWDHAPLVPVLERHPLLEATSSSNLFARALKSVATGALPLCGACDKGSIDNGTRWPQERRCQPLIPHDYVAVDEKPRLEQLQSVEWLERARIWHIRAENAYFPNEHNALKTAPNREQYLGALDKRTGRRTPGRPLGWEHKWFRGPSAPRRILDAGAGTCSGHAWMALEGLLEERLVFDFGFYDCSFAAVCSERGTPNMNWDWNLPLPVCSNCKFDLVNQVGGVHHQIQSCHHRGGAAEVACAEKAFDLLMGNFDRVLACGGSMWLHDGLGVLSSGKFWHWNSYVVRWARSRGTYETRDLSAGVKGIVSLHKRC